MTAELAVRFESLSFTPTQWRVMASTTANPSTP